MEKEYDENVDSLNDEEEVETTEDVEETEDELEDISDSPTLEDYEAVKNQLKELEEKNKQLYARIKKSGGKPNKTNTEQVKETDIIELARLASKGYSDEEISFLKDIKSVKGLNNLSEAIETPLFKATLKERQEKERKEKASLNSSNIPSTFKSGQEVTKEDLKKAWTGK